MKYTKNSTSILSTTLMVFACLTWNANAAVYSFSFGSDGSLSSSAFSNYTDVGGLIRGEIELPDGDGTFLPTLLIITDFPLAHGTDIFTNLVPTSWAIQAGSGFTVSGGVITDSNWVAQNGSVSADPMLGVDQIRFNFGDLNTFTLTGEPGQVTGNSGGFAGASYSAIPEPSSAILIGLGSLAAVARRRKI